MRFILIVVLIILFIYSLALVLLNGTPVSVDLWFSHVPEMRVGLLVLITLALGVILGLLLGVQVFRVFQSRWEIQRLHKEIDQLRKEQIQHAQLAATEAIAHQRSEKTSLDISPEDKSPL
ncbi:MULTISPECIES: lipopolysaccharide assembly protein LapA domain-containing protein [Acinetobacter]|uniref:lipopolysaccharide assembly protein LapA domain-containing protein n=1 Tax=Acinetobacter TaxID=469 RepID=UPI00124D0240|nr:MULTISPECIES: lipopolysaccharide assembly protein LapA domain-containing protein [Acinetobacter]MCG2575163.1 lipopolysaccharide assembly protein LapA domain-containing protein [Acinetobacter sp. ME22]